MTVCVVCGGNSFIRWGGQGGYSIMRCRGCGLGVTSPFPSAGALTEVNNSFYDAEKRADLYSSRREELGRRYKGYLSAIKELKPGGALLDVGCNIGMFMNAAVAAGFPAVGVEMNSGCAAYGREKFGLEIRTATLHGAAFPSGAFDVVTMFDVLEHVPDMHSFLAETARVLKKGGLLVVQSPNLGSLMAWLLRDGWVWLTPPDHLYHFTPGAMSRILGAHGFRVMKSRTWEPADDFKANIFSGFRASGLAARALRKALWLAAPVLIPLLQKLWWKAGKGGLIEVYAVKEVS